MSNRILSRLIFPLLLVFISATAMAASDKDAEGFIQDLAQNAISSVAVENISDGDRDAQFRKVFVSNFDIPEIGKFVLARYWHNATPEQQASFLQIFEDTQVLTWSHRFKTYNGVKLVVLGANKDDAPAREVSGARGSRRGFAGDRHPSREHQHDYDLPR